VEEVSRRFDALDALPPNELRRQYYQNPALLEQGELLRGIFPELTQIREAFGPLASDHRVLALGLLITRDRPWREDRKALAVLKTLPSRGQTAVEAYDAQKNRYRGPWTWKRLLHVIASDQALFRECEVLGWTEAGLVDRVTRPSGWRPIWEGRKTPRDDKTPMTRSEVTRLYKHYSRQKSILLGLGMKPPTDERESLRAHGLLDEDGRLISTPLVSLWESTPRREREQYVSVILHWFNHALANLQRYRYRHDPLPWDTDACGLSCLAIQRRLVRR
jgi:hypothetical protein